MKRKILTLAFFGLALTFSLPMISNDAHAGDTLFGKKGSGRPTNTAVGTIAGAATGTAIGQAVGGKDGWWIGTLVGSVLGGSVGNAWPTDEERYQRRHYKPTYSHRNYRSPSWHSRKRVRVCEPVVYEKTVVVEEAEAKPAVPAVPYGHLQNGTLKSPWSDFTMSVGGLRPGQTVYDAKTGQPFLVP